MSCAVSFIHGVTPSYTTRGTSASSSGVSKVNQLRASFQGNTKPARSGSVGDGSAEAAAAAARQKRGGGGSWRGGGDDLTVLGDNQFQIEKDALGQARKGSLVDPEDEDYVITEDPSGRRSSAEFLDEAAPDRALSPTHYHPGGGGTQDVWLGGGAAGAAAAQGGAGATVTYREREQAFKAAGGQKVCASCNEPATVPIGLFCRKCGSFF